MIRAAAATIFGLVALLAASSAFALADLARGRAALERGDFAAAEADLRPLAEFGLLDAQRELAKLYIQRGGDGDAEASVRWLRVAQERDPAVGVMLARELMRLQRPEDVAEIDGLLIDGADGSEANEALKLRVRLNRTMPQQTRRDVGAGLAAKALASDLQELQAEALRWYRQYSDTPDYAAVLRTACIEARHWDSDCYVDLLRARRRAGQPGDAALREEMMQRHAHGEISDEVVERYARLLLDDDLPGTPDVAGAYALLKSVSDKSLSARTRMGKLLLARPELDADADADAMLRAAHALGSGRAALYLGRERLREASADADPQQAERLLLDAAEDNPEAHYALGQLYENGYLGRAEPAKALDHYLRAARQGYGYADLALARMFSKNHGIRVNVVDAYAFARLAELQQLEEAQPLLDELRATLSNQQLHAGAERARREWSARQAASQPPSGTGVAHR